MNVFTRAANHKQHRKIINVYAAERRYPRGRKGLGAKALGRRRCWTVEVKGELRPLFYVAQSSVLLARHTLGQKRSD